MKTLTLLASIVFVASTSITAQTKETTALIMFEEDTITLGQFEQVYEKNNSNEMVNKSSVDEYLDLYIAFRRKVMEAEELGMDTLANFIREYNMYRDQLAQPYFTIDEVKEKLKKEAYERMKTDVKASHIMIKLSPNAMPKDTLQAYNKIMDIRKKIMKGADFADMAIEFSEDPSAKDNKGNLGYFTAFYMVYPFETAAYKTEVGEISMPVRTDYGYHLIKVEDKRPAKGKVKVAHILITEPAEGEQKSTEDVKQKIEEIYNKITDEGADFAEMARKYSEDFRSARAGGTLPAFGVGRMVPEFEQQAFSLKEVGDVSEPFKTDFGWHILMLQAKDTIGSYESLEAAIDEKVRKDSRSMLTQDAIQIKIKKQYGFDENPSAKKVFYELVDSSYFSARWEMPEFEKKNKIMFTLDDQEYTQRDFAHYLASRMSRRQLQSVRHFVDQMYHDFVKKSLLDYKDSQLEKEYPEFALLAQEYHDGILLFNLTDKKVWSKAVEDSAGLADFYEKHKNNYMWGERAKANIYTVQDEKMAKQTRKMVLKKEKKEYTTEDIKEEINLDSQLALKVKEGTFTKGENELLDQFWKKGVSELIKADTEYVVIEVLGILEAGPKSLDEARGEVVSDFQEHLMNAWMQQLEEKYPVKINEDALQELKTEYN